MGELDRVGGLIIGELAVVMMTLPTTLVTCEANSTS